MKICICDDNINDAKDLATKIKSYFDINNLNTLSIDTFFYADDFLNSIYKKNYDLIFLDIFINNENGFTIAKELKDKNFKIVLFTSSKDYAIEGYSINIFSYLLKPVNLENITKIMNKYFNSKKNKLITLKAKGLDNIISINDIHFIESKARQVFIHKENGKIDNYYYQLDEIEKIINSPNFLRTHKSYLINMDKIDKIDNINFITINKEVVRITKKNFNTIYNKYIDYIINEENSFDT